LVHSAQDDRYSLGNAWTCTAASIFFAHEANLESEYSEAASHRRIPPGEATIWFVVGVSANDPALRRRNQLAKQRRPTSI